MNTGDPGRGKKKGKGNGEKGGNLRLKTCVGTASHARNKGGNASTLAGMFNRGERGKGKRGEEGGNLLNNVTLEDSERTWGSSSRCVRGDATRSVEGKGGRR